MLIARQKKKENIIEYVIYMWHIEDLIRSMNFEIDRIQEKVIDKFSEPYSVKREMREWYLDLIKKMKDQGITEKGHLEELQEIVNELVYLHKTLLTIFQDKKYMDLYNTAIPNLNELRKRAPNTPYSEVEACMNGVYGLLMLRLKRKPISDGTTKAVETFSNLLAYLAKNYQDIKAGKKPFSSSINN